MEKQCPVCHIPLFSQELQETCILDVCEKCHGVFFDKNELRLTCSHDKIPKEFFSEPGFARDKSVCIQCASPNPRNSKTCGSCGAALTFLCPQCKIQMEETTRSGVSMDRCPTCGGIWLDGGELQLIYQDLQGRKKSQSPRKIHGPVVGGAGSDVAVDVGVVVTEAIADLIVSLHD